MLTLADGIERHGFEAVIACPGGGTLEQAAQAKGIAVAPVPLDRMRLTLNPAALAQYLRAWSEGSATLERIAVEQGIELIHTHHPVGALYARRAARRLGIPLVLHVHDGPPASLPYRNLLRRAAGDASLVVCVSEAARSVLAASRGDLGKARIVANPVDPIFLEGEVRPSAEVAGPGPNIGIFGVVEPRKGQDVFVEAAALLAGSHPEARFWIVGGAPHDDKRDFLRRVEALVEARGLGTRVTVTGHRDDVPALMKAMDVVVSASVSHESFGMVLAEAMALGRPVVTTAVGGTVEVVTDGVTGRVVPIRDPGALAAAIETSLNGATGGTAEAARAEARARFAPAVLQERVVALYEGALGRPGG